MKIEVYSDGSATTNDKPGGYGWVMVVDGEKTAEGSGHIPLASNNDAELEAAIQGLAYALKFINTSILATAKAGEYPQVWLVADSQLILGWASGHYKFKQASKMEKFHALNGLVRRMKVQTRHVYGHTGDEHNERCDSLANSARTGQELKEKKAVAKNTDDSLIGTKKAGTICVWYKNCLKVIDLDTNVIEDYKREVHGARGSALEIREEKSR